MSNPASGWQTFPLTSPVVLTNGQYYWLAIWSDDANARVYYSGSNGTLRWGPYNYGTWPDPMATTGGGNLNYCIYATGTGATLTTITVTPANPNILAGATQSFTATGTYSDGSTQDVTSQATWTSSIRPWQRSMPVDWLRLLRLVRAPLRQHWTARSGAAR